MLFDISYLNTFLEENSKVVGEALFQSFVFNKPPKAPWNKRRYNQSGEYQDPNVVMEGPSQRLPLREKLGFFLEEGGACGEIRHC